MTQFEQVDCSRGAPMGRPEYGMAPDCDRASVRLFKVHIDSGGYDDGGAYWGLGDPLYCAQGDEYQRFVRANSRKEARLKLDFEVEQLIRR